MRTVQRAMADTVYAAALRDALSHSGPWHVEIVERPNPAMHCVLVLDELGAIKPSEWVWDTVSHILNTRYNNQRTTIITTNLSDEPPAGASGDGSESATAARRANREATLGDRITERMRSRLHEMCRKVEMQGEDYRTKYRSASFR